MCTEPSSVLLKYWNINMQSHTHTQTLFFYSTVPWASRVHHNTTKLLHYVVDQHYETSWGDFTQFATVAEKKHVTAILAFSCSISKVIHACCSWLSEYDLSGNLSNSHKVHWHHFLLLCAFVWITLLQRDPPCCTPLISCSRQPAQPFQLAGGSQW